MSDNSHVGHRVRMRNRVSSGELGGYRYTLIETRFLFTPKSLSVSSVSLWFKHYRGRTKIWVK